MTLEDKIEWLGKGLGIYYGTPNIHPEELSSKFPHLKYKIDKIKFLYIDSKWYFNFDCTSIDRNSSQYSNGVLYINLIYSILKDDKSGNVK